jgi:hypothetical protein
MAVVFDCLVKTFALEYLTQLCPLEPGDKMARLCAGKLEDHLPIIKKLLGPFLQKVSDQNQPINTGGYITP